MQNKFSKKGSHVGMVISFVTFVTFIFFLFLILQPTTLRERNKNYFLDYIKLNLIGNATSEITSVTIEVTSPSSMDCINTNNIPSSQIPDEYRSRLVIKNPNEEILEYQISGQGFKIKTGTGFSGILKAYYSDEITNSESSLGGCDPKTVNIGVIKTYTELFESGLKELNETYYADYEGLKVELGIPEGTEFSFTLLDSSRNIIFVAEKYETPENTNVYSEETPIQYTGESGNTAFGFLVMKVW